MAELKALRKSLEEEWGECRRCELADSRRNVVIGEFGSPHFLLIGEAPGEAEDRIGFPYVGKAGVMLRTDAQDLGLDLSKQSSIVNVLGCRLPEGRRPKAGEVEACRPRLERIVHELSPPIVLLLGRVAYEWAFRRIVAIDRVRGRLDMFTNRWNGVETVVQCLVTYHPSHLASFRRDDLKYDLEVAWRVVEGQIK